MDMDIAQWKPFDDDLSLFPTGLRRFSCDLSVDLYEEDATLVAKMNLPGITPDELDITVDGDILTVAGMREEEAETEEKDYYSKEIRRGSFFRSVRLPKAVDAKAAGAAYEDGVLTVTLPVVAGQGHGGVKVPFVPFKKPARVA
ncbi:MAG TPA: Hsp20/alpha crystallin family protein [Candidatus Paceibacterota bacterium]|nr:Hsp20/alpha crystallin family protein [Candidatus Paceibacterota bacterium]